MKPLSPAPGVQTIGFLLIPGFALMSYAAACEPLRAANIAAGREIYRAAAFGPGVSRPGVSGPGTVAASNGALIPAAPLPARGAGLSALLVCAGGSPADWGVPTVHACLRAQARDGVRLGGISGGAWLLAAAGLLRDRAFTLHWEHAAALVEAFPDLSPTQARYVIDRDRITCGGGVAPLDLMHALIGERMGPAFARRVSDWFLHAEVSAPAAPQRGGLAERWGVNHPGLLAALEKLEATPDGPVPRAALARLAGVGPRQLDRLFRDHLGATPGETHRRLRLVHARRLLAQSPLSIAEIAQAAGFASASHFARAHRAEYGSAPRDARAAALASGEISGSEGKTTSGG